MLRELVYDATDLRNAFREARRREDQDDFNDEMAGRDNYKRARFLTGEQREDRKEQRSGQSRRADGMSRLQLLLATNPIYAALYNKTFDALRDAEDATDRAIVRTTAALEMAQTKLKDTMDRAPKINGTRVFKDVRGNVWTEHGQRVSDEDAAKIEWRGFEPAYEQFLEVSESVKDRLTHLEDLQGFRVDTLGGIRDRMMDQDNPPSADELDRYQQQIAEGLKQHVHSAPSPDRVLVLSGATAGIAIPQIP